MIIYTVSIVSSEKIETERSVNFTAGKTEEIKLGKSAYLVIKKDDLKKNNYYTFRLHYLDALSVAFNVKIICKNDVINKGKNNFFTVKLDENRGIEGCNDSLDEKNIIFELSPIEIAGRIRPEKDIISSIHFIPEFVESKFNTDEKIFYVIFDKGLANPLLGLLVILLIVSIYYFTESQVNEEKKKKDIKLN